MNTDGKPAETEVHMEMQLAAVHAHRYEQTNQTVVSVLTDMHCHQYKLTAASINDGTDLLNHDY